MNHPAQIEEKNSITFEVIRYITFYYFSVAIFLTLSQVFLEYFQIKRNIELQILEIEDSFSESLTNSLWEFNDVQTKAIIDGIAKTPSITFVSVNDPSGSIVYSAGRDEQPAQVADDLMFDPDKVFLFKKDLTKSTEDQGKEFIGTLTIYSGNKIIYQQLSHIIFSIIINSIIKTISLWGILLVFFNRKLKSPLDQFVKSIAAINPKNPTPVDLEESKHILEFSRIQVAFNDLIKQLTNYKEVLEAIVENKTELLKEKNEEMVELINQLNQAQEQILKQEKLTSLGILSAGIAHELKNPLNLSKNTNLMIRDVINENNELDPGFKSEIQQFLNIAIENHDRMNNIIKNMLVQARIQNSDHSEINLREFINTNYNMLLKSRQSNVDTRLDFKNYVPKDINIQVQANDFGRLLLNLFENAVHSISEKGKMLGEGFKGRIEISASRKSEDMISIEFKDNGKGIEKANINKIIEPFFTTKPAGSGTGLGLYLTYEIVKQHNGKIQISSEPGEYASFIIDIPVKQEEVVNGAP